jgi:hypothetical protein
VGDGGGRRRVRERPHRSENLVARHSTSVALPCTSRPADDARGSFVGQDSSEKQRRSAVSHDLRRGGVTDDLVSVTIYLTDVADYQSNGREIGAVWRELAGTRFPAMAGIGITALWQPEAMIEIAGVAVLSAAPIVAGP